MSANTSPDNIVYPVSTDQVAPLETVFATMASSIQTALSNQGKYFVPNVSTQAARDDIFPLPVQGNRVFRADKGWEETYFGLYSAATNATGATPAGWYPTGGAMPIALLNRSASTATLSATTYNDMTATTFWTPETLHGGFTFTNGLVVPVTGIYRVTATLHATGTSGDMLAGIYVGALPTSVAGMRGGTISGSLQSNALCNVHLLAKFVAGDVIKLASLGTAATSTWAVNSGVFTAAFIAPAR